MERMKLLFVVTKGNWGGAQRYVHDLAAHLPKDQFEVAVAFGQPGTLKDELEKSGVRTIPIKNLERDMNILKDLLSFFELISIYRKEKPDIVHLNSSKIGGLGALAARIVRVHKIVFTVHGFAFNEDRPMWQKAMIRLATWMTLLLSTDVITISEHEYEQSRRFPFVAEKIHLVYNGMSEPEFMGKINAQQETQEISGIPAAAFQAKVVIGAVAELTKNKGLRYAIEAMKDQTDTTFIIIGGGEEKETLRELIYTLGLEEKVYLAGFVPNASRLLKAFDIFLLPSLKEGIPYVIFEAGYAKVPIISTFVGGIPEILEDRVTALRIEPTDSDSIRNALQEVWKNGLNVSITGTLYDTIKERFSLEKMVRATEVVYFS